ncbi:MAG: hypothetical protein MZU91_07335 [Desulfosudis oleivorans]|nr:hypothetical protein [Desulfosudis oleivorans]
MARSPAAALSKKRRPSIGGQRQVGRRLAFGTERSSRTAGMFSLPQELQVRLDALDEKACGLGGRG